MGEHQKKYNLFKEVVIYTAQRLKSMIFSEEYLFSSNIKPLRYLCNKNIWVSTTAHISS